MLKKIAIGFGLLFATLVAAGAVFWFGWLTPPASDAVCSNVETVIDEDLDEQLEGKNLPKELVEKMLAKAKKDTLDHCERFSTKKPLTMARAVWVKRLECMKTAADMDGLETCDAIKSF